MFFFSPLCEFLLLVSPQFSENGEKDGSSAECSSSTGNLESVMLAVIALHSSIFLLLLLQKKFCFKCWNYPSGGMSFPYVFGKAGKVFHLQMKNIFPKATSDSLRCRPESNLNKS